MASLVSVISKFYGEYVKTTPKKLKIIDAYLLYILLTGVVQFVYCCLVGTFPFNSFLSGFISCVSCFVLTVNILSVYKICALVGSAYKDQLKGMLVVDFMQLHAYLCLRLQVNPQNRSQFYGISPERGFADFIFAHIILHIVVINFIG